jgi:exosortase
MQATAQSPTHVQSVSFWIDGLFAAALLAHLPLGFEYSRRMWSVGHYQFFPLLLAAVVWLIYDRLIECRHERPRGQTSYWVLAANAVLLLVATLMFSPFFWILSLLLLVGNYVYDRWGVSGVKYVAPAWLLLLFIVPLPSNLDLKLVNQLQFLSSQLASYILDAFGQIHFREGVVLITEKKQFFTEEACSGIRSLFSSLSAMAIYGVMMRYGWKRHLFNIVQTVLWVIVGNAVRIALVVYLADNVNESFAHGTIHEMFGLANFVFVFLCALSTDRGINAWHAASEDVTQAALRGDVEEPIIDGEVVRSAKNGRHAERPVGWRWSLIAAFVLIGVFAARLTYAKTVVDNFRFDDEILVESTADDLPKRMFGWEQVRFEHQKREDIRLLAPESYVWTFVKQGRRVVISLDSPYFDFHNLNDCYEGFGWKVDYENRYPTGESSLTSATNLTQLDMKKSNDHGLVLFTAFDRDGALVRPTFDLNYDPTKWMEVVRHVRLALGVLSQDNDPKFSKQTLPISQVQLLLIGNEPVADVEEIERLFVEVRSRLLQTSRFKRD